MVLRKTILYTICLLLVALLGVTLTYQGACLLSAYPNDWFLDERIYAKDDSFFQSKNLKHRFICAKEDLDWLEPYSENFEALLENQVAVLRNHQNRTVFLLQLGDRHVVLKRYNIKSVFNFLQRAPIRSSLAYRSWHYGHKLLSLGIATPKPLALFEKRIGPLWTTSYVITEYLDKHYALDDQLDDYPKEETIALLKKVKDQLALMKQSQLIHSDYGYRNLLIKNKTPYLIDLDDMHEYHFLNTFFLKRFREKHNKQIEKEIQSLSGWSVCIDDL